MKNSSPYAKDKLVHGSCPEGLGNLRHHHSATVVREDILFTLIFCLHFFFLGLFYSVSRFVLEAFINWSSLAFDSSVRGNVHESCSLLKLTLIISMQ